MRTAAGILWEDGDLEGGDKLIWTTVEAWLLGWDWGRSVDRRVEGQCRAVISLLPESALVAYERISGKFLVRLHCSRWREARIVIAALETTGLAASRC